MLHLFIAPLDIYLHSTSRSGFVRPYYIRAVVVQERNMNNNNIRSHECGESKNEKYSIKLLNNLTNRDSCQDFFSNLFAFVSVHHQQFFLLFSSLIAISLRVDRATRKFEITHKSLNIKPSGEIVEIRENKILIRFSSVLIAFSSVRLISNLLYINVFRVALCVP